MRPPQSAPWRPCARAVVHAHAHRRRSRDRAAGHVDRAPAGHLAERLEALRQAGGLPAALRDLGVPREGLATLAADAATQWTGTCNPRPFDAAAALDLYERAY
ncbi:MAG: hypothetical protein DMG04_02195 [Acidobacteria bacterium]|nr:MAG: hypothetical protein DMG04_02195 [Acidobacteriota bacterium]PYQ78575.1 MAG: hypothetical protein DMG03_28050 [Acidobacteriota bacterium]PYQ86839.1 MAG: hypothetical protein DMG02_24445 [Acidobacteriota bacterium]PYR13698.1 MAG: hypothetical protein DMF99_00650 [Acidobacteriota bacterium]